MAQIILFLGGARSGKSRFAQQLAERLGGAAVLFVATAEAGDLEMANRIEAHKNARPRAWDTLEVPINVGCALAGAPERFPVVLIDCLTLLVSNVLLGCGDPVDISEAEKRMRDECNSLLAACRQRRGFVIIVSSEVGQGLVPDNRLGRVYRDVLGWTNQAIAAAADAVFLMVAGLPVEVKRLAVSIDELDKTFASPELSGPV
jgi:adenosylcobinamide kinase/adenosylcobinamide-phosphate guanylyltransferase